MIQLNLSYFGNAKPPDNIVGCSEVKSDRRNLAEIWLTNFGGVRKIRIIDLIARGFNYNGR